MKNFIIYFTFIVICNFSYTTEKFNSNQFQSTEHYENFKCLFKTLSNDTFDTSDSSQFFHIIQNIDFENNKITLKDGSEWNISYPYQSTIQNWKVKDKLKIYTHSFYPINNIEIENFTKNNTVWGKLTKKPIKPTVIRKFDNDGSLILSNGLVLKPSFFGSFNYWKEGENIFIFHNNEKTYDLWNLDLNEMRSNWNFLNNEKNILQLESQLKKHIIGQNEAIKLVTLPIINYRAGLQDPNKPISVFLFLGPTGVGKTEFSKMLAKEFYGNSNQIIRFDMSHFAQEWCISRFIGSGPGYIDSEKGGQLTEALKKTPKTIVLLDEIEKAHDKIRKFFLPVFDEGFVKEALNNKIIDCKEAIFIMTSNLCGEEISTMYQNGYSSQEILESIEPKLMTALSPELYNRVEPILFRPLEMDSMKELVELMLKEVIFRINEKMKINLIIDQTVKDYLIKHGFHPTLGARPLKKLIDKKIIANISYAIINEEIPFGTQLTLSYLSEEDIWNISWF